MLAPRSSSSPIAAGRLAQPVDAAARAPLRASAATAGRDVRRFTAGVFAVSTAGGLVLVFGPGHAPAHFVSQPQPAHRAPARGLRRESSLVAAAASSGARARASPTRLADRASRAGGLRPARRRRDHGRRAADRAPLLRCDQPRSPSRAARLPQSRSSSLYNSCSSRRSSPCSRCSRSRAPRRADRGSRPGAARPLGAEGRSRGARRCLGRAAHARGGWTLLTERVAHGREQRLQLERLLDEGVRSGRLCLLGVRVDRLRAQDDDRDHRERRQRL